MKSRLYSRSAIFGFSALLSTFFGALLFATNLHETGRKKDIWKVVLFSLIWHGVFSMGILRLATDLFSSFLFLTILGSLIPGVLGGIILAKPVWNYYLQDISEFDRRPIWGPLILSIVLAAGYVVVVLISLRQ